MPVYAVGDVLAGRYEIQDFLGSGSFGEVYKVLDQHQSVVVALKLLHSTPAPGAWNEAQVLTQLRSPYILPVWNADFAAGVPFLITELAQNGSADARLGAPGVPIALAVRWVRAACRGATRTHDAGLLHRDIKPDNLFLTTSSEAVLGDFGIAVLMDANGRAPWGGTLVTMAPETAAQIETSVRSDVYSLGATLYALLAGQYAHHDPDPNRLAQMVINDPPSPLRDVAPHVPQALAQRIGIAMARTPGDRYPSPAAFDAALGTLPRPSRDWTRTDEHGGHTYCWRGSAAGKADAMVCVVASGTRFEVVAAHDPSGRRIVAACRAPAPASRRPQNVRAALRNIS
jgi:eukaryotic-like serine/threonine-protein kinase